MLASFREELLQQNSDLTLTSPHTQKQKVNIIATGNSIFPKDNNE